MAMFTNGKPVRDQYPRRCTSDSRWFVVVSVQRLLMQKEALFGTPEKNNTISKDSFMFHGEIQLTEGGSTGKNSRDQPIRFF